MVSGRLRLGGGRGQGHRTSLRVPSHSPLMCVHQPTLKLLPKSFFVLFCFVLSKSFYQDFGMDSTFDHW